ncbi:sugar transferase [uncultured Clostridium sp.]|uniref:sugar transferase n=1 Tax=uncultured Clostridium sp. TaxID=59620 RepID=UPI0032164E0C
MEKASLHSEEIHVSYKEKLDYTEKKSSLFVYNLLKRGFDVVFSIALLIVTSPILIISMLIVFFQDFKSPIFSQKRVGVNNEEFTMYKIRSMVHNAESDGFKWASKDDCRITTFGKFIRKTRIDELPQLLNVLKGDMSVVGPRPELEFFYKKFEKTIPNFRGRLAVKPGLTGWAQVNGGYDLLPEEKLKYDVEYIAIRSITVDIKVLFKTIKVVFTGDGAR